MIPTDAQITMGAKAMKTDLKHPVRRYTQARCVLTPVLTDIEEKIEALRPPLYTSSLSTNGYTFAIQEVLAILRGGQS